MRTLSVKYRNKSFDIKLDDSDYEKYSGYIIRINMSRGKPRPQLDLPMGLKFLNKVITGANQKKVKHLDGDTTNCCRDNLKVIDPVESKMLRKAANHGKYRSRQRTWYYNVCS